MNKTILKLLSFGLATVTFLNFPNVSANAQNRGRNELSTAAKVCIGIGAGALVLLGGYAIICAVDRSNDGKTHFEDVDPKVVNNPGGNGGYPGGSCSKSVTNANLSNIDNLCYWHSFIQQMYSLKAFRRFIDTVDVSKLSKDVRPKILAFRDFFKKMDSQKSITADECQAFAVTLMTGFYNGRQNDIYEVLPSFIGDIDDEYSRFCKEHFHTSNPNQYSNVFGQPFQIGYKDITLQDLLKVSSGCESEKIQAIRELMKDESLKNKIIRDYLEGICVDGTEIHDVINANNVMEYVDKVKSVSYRDDFSYLKNYLISTSDEEAYNKFLNSVANVLEDKEPVKKAVLGVYEAKGTIDVPVLDDQFVLFVNRTLFDGNGKNCTPIHFGGGIVKHKGNTYKLTAVSAHSGSTRDGGHYITYKQEKDGKWYCYNDCSSSAQEISFEAVKKQVEDKCTMFTFSKV